MRIYCYRIIAICSYLFIFLKMIAEGFIGKHIPDSIFYVIAGILLAAGVILIRFKKQIISLPKLSSIQKCWKIAGIFLISLFILTACNYNEYTKEVIRTVSPYLLYYVTFSALLLRSLYVELHQVGKKQFYALQRVQLLVFYGFCMLIYLLRIPHLIFYGIVSFLSSLFSLVVKAPDRNIFRNVKVHVSESMDLKGYREAVEQAKAAVGVKPQEIVQQVHQEIKYDTAQFERQVMILLIVTLFAILLVYMIRMLKKPKYASIEVEEEEREQIKGMLTVSEQKLGKHAKSRQIRLRYFYREFLRACQKHQIKLNQSDTTKKIEDKYTSQWKDQEKEVEELTSIYRRTRYQCEYETSEEELKKVKNLIKGLFRS